MTRPNGSSKKSRSETRTFGRARERAERELARAGIADAAHDARLLLEELTGLDRGSLHLARERELDPEDAERYELWVRRRAGREPLQHVVGTAYFFGHAFEIDARALVPRPETERLVELALAGALPHGARVADLGTGSGCIAVSIALARPDLVVDAVDRSPAALELAAANARRHGVSIRLYDHDFGDPPDEWRGTFDAVLSNPPYIAAGELDALEPEVRVHDPRDALVAGRSGYEAFERIAPAALSMLKHGGRLLVEIGFGQADAARKIFERAGFDVGEVVPDWSGIARVLSATRPEEAP